MLHVVEEQPWSFSFLNFTVSWKKPRINTADDVVRVRNIIQLIKPGLCNRRYPDKNRRCYHSY
jgi:hypothetical protein